MLKMSSLFLELSKQQKLLQMMEERGFTLCQQNGQRTYGGPPPNWGSRPPPSRDCEVFIGRIPRMCFEDELIPLFNSVGELYEFRLMLDFSGTNRGYGYAHYATYQGAMNAIKILNRYEIRPGHHIGVLKSKNNCRLLFGNIRRGFDQESFSTFIRSVTGQVLNVFMFSSFDQLRRSDLSISLEVEEAFLERMPRNSMNCQFAIVEFENHKAAAVARRILIPRYGHILAIDWAVPPRERKKPLQVEETSSIPALHLPVSVENNRNGAIPVKGSAKARPVPTLVACSSVFDNISYMPKAFINVVKYFKFLINVTLQKSVQRGEVPVNVYLELEKKIVDRIVNLENCGQAVQLIFNYLSWYNDSRVNPIDGESQKILHEVKMFADYLVHFVFQRITYGKSSNSELEEYYCSILPIQLNFLFRFALVMAGDERAKVCGRITVSLQWINDIVQKVKAGDAKLKEFLIQISRVDSAISDELELKQLWSAIQRQEFPNMVKIPFVAGFGAPVQNCNRNDFFKTRSLSGSSTSSGQTFADDFTPDYLGESDLKESACTGKTNSFQIEGLISNQNGLDCFATAKDQVGLSQAGGIFNKSNGNDFFGEQNNLNLEKNIFGPVGGSSSWDNKIWQPRPVPALTCQPSVTDLLPYMPKAFFNVVKYFKYIIEWNLQKRLTSEVPLQMYKEIEMKILCNIGNLDSCSKAVDLITEYLQLDINGELGKILQDVKVYSDSFLNFIRGKESFGLTPSRDLEDYYCRVLPYQLSFLFHLALVIVGEEKNKLSGRVSAALQWLNELIHKNKAGDIEVIDFFEQISMIAAEKGEGSNGYGNISSLVREAYNEYNIIVNPFVTSQNSKFYY